MMKNKIGPIGVLMGGPSSEREISLESGRAVYRALKEQGLDVLAIDIQHGSLSKIKQAGIKLAFIALHGQFGEDGTIQGILESWGIPYTGSGVIASQLCLNKIASRNIFKHHQIPTPEFKILNYSSWQEQLRQLKFKFPVVVKPSSQGSSIGISLVYQAGKLQQAIEAAFEYDREIMVEEYIRGREITVGILQDQALPVVEIVPKKKFFDFQAKYEGKSKYIIPAKLPNRVYRKTEELGLLVHRVLGCRAFSRADMMLSNGQPIVLEVNSIPGLTAQSLLPMAAQAKGISFAELCLKIVYSSLKKTESGENRK